MSKIYIKNMVVEYYFQQRPMESNRTRSYKFRNKKKKIWMDWPQIKKRRWRDTKGCPTLEPSGKQEERKTEKCWRRSVMKEAGGSWNELRFLGADRQKWKGLVDNLCS